MTRYAIPVVQIAIDVDTTARNYQVSTDGTSNVRMGSKALTMAQIGEAVNQALGRQPRPWAWMHHSSNALDEHTAVNTGTDQDPLYEFLVSDNVPNANTHIVRILSLPRTTAAANATNAFAFRRYGTSEEQTSYQTGRVNIANAWFDATYHEFEINRGPAAAADINEFLSTYEGFTITSVVIQDKEERGLDSNYHEVVTPGTITTGQPIAANAINAIFEGLDKARRNNLPVDCCWSAARSSGNVVNVSTTGRDGVIITNEVFVNLLDINVTTRTQNTPGVSCGAWRAGIGQEDIARGQLVRKNCRVKAEANGTSSGAQVNFWGPVDSNAITVTTNVPAAWYNADIFLNSAINSVENSVSENKIDILGKVANATTDQLRIYAVSIEGKYGV